MCFLSCVIPLGCRRIRNTTIQMCLVTFLRVVKAAEKNYPGDIVMQLSAVFHDVAKGLPEIRGINKEGQPNDLGHEEAGIPIAEKALLRLQFGKVLAKQVCFIVKFHGIKMDENPRRGSVVRQLRKMKPFFQDKSKLIEGVTKLFQFMDCDADGFDPAFEAEIKRVNATVFAMFEKVLSDTIFYRDELPINGKQLMAWGIHGKKIGEVLNYLVTENIQDIETIIKRLTKQGLISADVRTV